LIATLGPRDPGITPPRRQPLPRSTGSPKPISGSPSTLGVRDDRYAAPTVGPEVAEQAEAAAGAWREIAEFSFFGEQVMALANELTAAGADWQIHMYGKTMHGFTNNTENLKARKL